MAGQAPGAIDAPTTWTIQQAARISGLSEHNLRYYEGIGLIPGVQRDPSSGHRRYTPANLRRCEGLACLRALGMPLEEMRNYVEGAGRGVDAADDQIAILEHHQRALGEQIDRLRRLRDSLDLKTAYWRARKAGDEAAATAAAGEFARRVRAELDHAPTSD